MDAMTVPDHTHVPPRLQGERSEVDDAGQVARVRRRLARRAFAVVSTASPAGFPHAAGVVYETIDDEIYFHTLRSSRKARNIAAEPRVAVVVPDRRLPVGPPFTLQFQGRAEIVAMDDPEIVRHLDAGRLGSISGHGALDEADGCFVRIRPGDRVHTYGIGVSALAVARDPLHAGHRTVEL